MQSVPEDRELPSGWVCRRVTADELVVGHRLGSVEVIASRTDEADLLPFESGRGWDLACRLRAGEVVSERTIGRASTRDGALDALRSCMEDVSALVRSAGSTEELSLTGIVRELQTRERLPSMGADAITTE